MLKINLLRSCPTVKGDTVFIYAVSGNKKDLASYKEAQGEYYNETKVGKKKATPLYFTKKFKGVESEIQGV